MGAAVIAVSIAAGALALVWGARKKATSPQGEIIVPANSPETNDTGEPVAWPYIPAITGGGAPNAPNVQTRAATTNAANTQNDLSGTGPQLGPFNSLSEAMAALTAWREANPGAYSDETGQAEVKLSDSAMSDMGFTKVADSSDPSGFIWIPNNYVGKGKYATPTTDAVKTGALQHSGAGFWPQSQQSTP